VATWRKAFLGFVAVGLVQLPAMTHAQSRPPAARPSRVDRVVSADMLKAQVPYLEKVIGPAKYVNGDVRTYEVSGCTVDVHVSNNAVRAFEMYVTPRCSPDMNRFLGGPRRWPPLLGMTFGQFTGIENGEGIALKRMFATCLGLCGNAADPIVYQLYEGPHVEGYLEVALESVIAYPPSIEASERWEKVMPGGQGEHYIWNHQFNCDPNVDDAGIAAFKDVKIDRIAIGYDLEQDMPGASTNSGEPVKCPQG